MVEDSIIFLLEQIVEELEVVAVVVLLIVLQTFPQRLEVV
jgi:hypothetical protein